MSAKRELRDNATEQAGLRTILGITVFDNLAATVAPTATDDTTAGYSVGSLWFNNTSRVM